MIEVRQYDAGKFWRKFKVTNPKQIEFWKAIAKSDASQYTTKIFIEK